MPKPHMRPVGASAVVTVTVQVRAQGSWGPDCSVAQVHRQAAEEAINSVRNALRHAGYSARMQVVGEPEVKTTIVEREK